MRRGAALAVAVLGACRFDATGGPLDDLDAPVGSGPDAMPTPPADARVPLPPDALQVVCPPEYDLPSGASRYRLSGAKATWLAAELDCADDTQNRWSHLVAIDTGSEWTDVTVAAGLTRPGEWWSIGVVRDAASTAGPWRKVTGGPQAPLLPWRQTPGPDEPTNTTPGEPVVVLDGGFSLSNNPNAGGFIDVTIDGTFYFVCECDGLPPVNATY